MSSELCVFFCLLLRWLQNHMIWKYALLLIELYIFAEENKKHSKTFAAICTPTKRIERNEIHILTYNKTWNDRKKTHSTGEKKIIETKIRRIKRWKALLSRLKIDSPLITSVMWMSYRRIDNIITVVDLVCCSFSVVVWLPIFCVFFSFFSFSLSDAKC